MPDGTPWPLVSIITPSYNQAKFLEETIRSVILQGYPNLEYIIMDGGSTDGSVEIIQKYAPFLAYWTSQKDAGQSAAINAGFMRAQGPYLAWLNSDDVYLPGAIQQGIEALHPNLQAGMAFGQTEVIDEQGHRIGVFEPVQYRFEDLLSMKIILPQQAAFFRKSIFESIGYLRTDLDYAMDVELFIRIGAFYAILPVKDTLAQFRLSSSNKGVMAKAHWCAEFIKICDDFFSSPELVQKYAHLRSAAYGGAYYRGAHTYLEIGLYPQARTWFNLAAHHNRRFYLKPGWWKAQLFALLGKPGRQMTQSFLLWMRKNRLHVNETNWQIGLADQQSSDPGLFHQKEK
jgi:glycosyltransferase involved in cell wall biosynthesis